MSDGGGARLSPRIDSPVRLARTLLKKAELGRFDQSFHLHVFGVRMSRTAELTTTDNANDLIASLCVRTAAVEAKCSILSCPSDVSGTDSRSCVDLTTGKLTGTDPASACALGSCGATPLPVEADFVAQYMQTNYPACVGSAK
jgi:hypothetical protein